MSLSYTERAASFSPLPGKFTDLSTTTQSRKVRLKQLAQQISAMEAAAARHCPIPVLRLEQGQRPPRSLPTDALIIRLGTTDAKEPSQPA